MASPSIERLINDTKGAFSRELTVAEIERYADRLPVMLRNLRALAAWSSRLEASGPSQVQQVSEDAMTTAHCAVTDNIGR